MDLITNPTHVAPDRFCLGAVTLGSGAGRRYHLLIACGRTARPEPFRDRLVGALALFRADHPAIVMIPIDRVDAPEIFVDVGQFIGFQ